MSNGNQGEAIGAFMRYVEVFERLDPQAIVSYYYEPTLLISPQGIASLSTGAYVEQFFESLMADLKAQGYARSEFPRLAELFGRGELLWQQFTMRILHYCFMMHTLCRPAIISNQHFWLDGRGVDSQG